MNVSNLLFESIKVRVYVGVLRSGSAAVNSNLITSSHLSQPYEPYSDNPETVGVMRLDSNVLRTVIPRFYGTGGKWSARLAWDDLEVRLCHFFVH